MSISWGAMTWVSQPRQWRSDGRDLHVRTEDATDFWRASGHGVVRDTGHAFLARVQGDLAAEVTVRADFAAERDQAGLMLRLDHQTWLTAGVQRLDGELYASVVSARGASDASMAPLGDLAPESQVRFRLSRADDAATVTCSVDGGRWRVLRIAPVPAAVPIGIGPMCCSPNRAGLAVWFSEFELEEPDRSWTFLGAVARGLPTAP